MASRQVGPVAVVAALVVVVVVIGGIWFLREKQIAAAVTEPSNRAANVRRALQNPETLNKLKSMAAQGQASGTAADTRNQ